MKAEMKENDSKTYLEIPLKSLNGIYKWTILVNNNDDFHNRQPVEITEEKKQIANKIIDILNNE